MLVVLRRVNDDVHMQVDAATGESLSMRHVKALSQGCFGITNVNLRERRSLTEEAAKVLAQSCPGSTNVNLREC